MIIDRLAEVSYTNSIGVNARNEMNAAKLAGDTAKYNQASKEYNLNHIEFDVLPDNPFTGIYYIEEAPENHENDIYSDKQIGTHGENVQSTFMGSRLVDIKGRIFFVKSTPDAILMRKTTIQDIFNPTLKTGGEIEYGRKGKTKKFYLRNVYPTSTVRFSESNGGLIFSVTLKAPDPFWRERTELVRLSFVQKNMYYPRSFPQAYNAGGINPKNGKMYFDLRRSNLETTVNNIGKVDTGIEMMFSALGELVNPSITNVDTGRTIKLNLTMQKDDWIKIISFPKEFRVIMKDGSNGAKYVDPSSRPFILPTGYTTMKFETDLNVLFLDILLAYSPQYLGAENFWGVGTR